MSDMIHFKDWEEMWWFIDNYCNFSCLNCHYGGNDGNPSRHLFCRRSISMVDFNIMTLCAEWRSDKGKGLRDYDGDCPLYSLSDEMLDKLCNGEITVRELREEGYEKVKE